MIQPFVLIYYYEAIQRLYVQCVISGNRQGGSVHIGPFNTVTILISHPIDTEDGPPEELLDVTSPTCSAIEEVPGGPLQGVD